MEIDSRRIRKLIRQSRSHERMVDRVLRSLPWLDPVGSLVQRAVGAVYTSAGTPGRAIRNLMHGTTLLGHPLHPALSDLPLGAWTVGVIADWLFVATGRVPAVAGDLALVVGVVGAILAALSGLTDHHDTTGYEQRVATAHGLTMSAVLVVELASLAMRVWVPGLHLSAVVLSSLAWLGALQGAYVGAHMSFGMGTAVNHNAFFEGPAQYVRVGTRDDFPEGQMRTVVAEGLPVLIVRRNGLLRAIGAVCAHAGGPLDEGKIEGEVVECPWHYSRFRVADGRVVGGPATFDQPLLVARERGGIVEVKLANPLK